VDLVRNLNCAAKSQKVGAISPYDASAAIALKEGHFYLCDALFPHCCKDYNQANCHYFAA